MKNILIAFLMFVFACQGNRVSKPSSVSENVQTNSASATVESAYDTCESMIERELQITFTDKMTIWERGLFLNSVNKNNVTTEAACSGLYDAYNWLKYRVSQQMAIVCAPNNDGAGNVPWEVQHIQGIRIDMVYAGQQDNLDTALLNLDWYRNNPQACTGTSTMQIVAAPTFSPAAGTYTSTQNIILSSATAGAEIRYTQDGSTPSCSSTLYSSAISISASKMIKAIGCKNGMTTSTISSSQYTINSQVQTVAAPTFSPGAGTYTSAQNISLSSGTVGADIHYTLDGSSPSCSSPLYSSVIALSSSKTIKAIACKSGYVSSIVSNAQYVINISSNGISDCTNPDYPYYFKITVKNNEYGAQGKTEVHCSKKDGGFETLLGNYTTVVRIPEALSKQIKVEYVFNYSSEESKTIASPVSFALFNLYVPVKSTSNGVLDSDISAKLNQAINYVCPGQASTLFHMEERLEPSNPSSSAYYWRCGSSGTQISVTLLENEGGGVSGSDSGSTVASRKFIKGRISITNAVKDVGSTPTSGYNIEIEFKMNKTSHPGWQDFN